ncbi:MAG: TolC family protein [Phycisphaerales bacterium]|nr:MAG: TolC family protein [Phycisphaerales bacterium]
MGRSEQRARMTLARGPVSPVRRRCLIAASVSVAFASSCGLQAGSRHARIMNAALDLKAYQASAPVISHPLTLDKALELADRHNIEVWIAAAESRYQHELATQSTLKMLPSLMAGTEYGERSRYDASSSQSLETGKESLEPSFSSEKRTRTFDVSATWNLLDFGISYLRARQQNNRVFIVAQRERRVRQNLVLQVTQAYWRAVAARESAGDAEKINTEVSAKLASMRGQIADKTISELDALKRETSLLERQDELRRYKREFLKAKTELGKLIGLVPGTSFTLAEVDLDQPVDELDFDAEALEQEALQSRPELYEKDSEEAISRDEARIALARMFPSPAMFLRFDYNSNRFLVFDHWNTLGIRASWDLLSIPQQLAHHGAMKLQTELITKRRTAIAVAILTQLHLSLIDYADAHEQYEFSETISLKRGQLLEAVQSQVTEGKSHGGEVLDQRMKHLKLRAKHLSARVNLMTSMARLLNTIGRERSIHTAESLHEEIASHLEGPVETVACWLDSPDD